MNDCKLMIGETSKSNKNNIGNKYKNLKLEMKNTYTTLYDNYQSKVVITDLNKYCANNINNFFQSLSNPTKSIWNFIPWYNKKISSTEIYKNSLVKTINFYNGESTESKILEPIDEYFIDLAMSHFQNNGYKVIKQGMIEYRNYNLKNCENDAIYFDVYKDDELFDFRVDTCIFITNNNENISGNIDFYVISSPNINKKIANSEINISKKEIKIINNSVILISGNILYCPQPLYGLGIRNCIIIRLRSNRN